jgi:hypothetical protein
MEKRSKVRRLDPPPGLIRYPLQRRGTGPPKERSRFKNARAGRTLSGKATSVLLGRKVLLLPPLFINS